MPGGCGERPSPERGSSLRNLVPELCCCHCVFSFHTQDADGGNAEKSHYVRKGASHRLHGRLSVLPFWAFWVFPNTWHCSVVAYERRPQASWLTWLIFLAFSLLFLPPRSHPRTGSRAGLPHKRGLGHVLCTRSPEVCATT